MREEGTATAGKRTKLREAVVNACAGERTKLREAQLIINVKCAGCHRREENKVQGSEAVQHGMPSQGREQAQRSEAV